MADVGTGSGAIALALKAERPDLVGGRHGLERRGALEVARGNAARLGLEVEFLQGDLLEPVTGELDAVVSNPPYVAAGDQLPPDIALHEPREALFARRGRARRHPPPDRRGRRRAVPRARGRRRAGARRGGARCDAWPRVEAVRDLAGHERVVVGRAA